VPDSKKRSQAEQQAEAKKGTSKNRTERKAAALEKFGVLHAKGSLWATRLELWKCLSNYL